MGETLSIRTTRTYVAADQTDRKLVHNLGPNTLYYGDQSVTSSSYADTLASGDMAELAQGQWFVATAATRLRVSSVDEATTALEDHEASLAHSPRFDAIYAGTSYRRAVVSLRFDDGPAADYTTLFTYLKDRDLVAGIAVNTGGANAVGAVGRVTYAQLREMQGRGIEIMNHSRSHLDPAGAGGFGNFLREIADCQESLEAEYVFAQSFVQPGTWTGSYYLDTPAKLSGDVGRKLLKTFATAEAYNTTDDPGAGTGLLGVKALPTRARLGLTQASVEESTLAAAKLHVDNAIYYGGHAHLLVHFARIGTQGYMSSNDFTAFLDYVKTKRDAGYIDVLNPTAAHYARPAASKFNLLYDGDFEDQTAGAYPTGAGYPWRVVTGTPTIEASGRSGKCLRATGVTKRIQQRIAAGTVRALRFEAYAKGVAVGSSTARVNMAVTDGTTNFSSVNFDSVVTNAGWTKLTGTIGNDPRATYITFEPTASSSGVEIDFDDIAVYKT